MFDHSLCLHNGLLCNFFEVNQKKKSLNTSDLHLFKANPGVLKDWKFLQGEVRFAL